MCGIGTTWPARKYRGRVKSSNRAVRWSHRWNCPKGSKFETDIFNFFNIVCHFLFMSYSKKKGVCVCVCIYIYIKFSVTAVRMFVAVWCFIIGHAVIPHYLKSEWLTITCRSSAGVENWAYPIERFCFWIVIFGSYSQRVLKSLVGALN
jgi:hypothetical protein